MKKEYPSHKVISIALYWSKQWKSHITNEEGRWTLQSERGSLKGQKERVCVRERKGKERGKGSGEIQRGWVAADERWRKNGGWKIWKGRASCYSDLPLSFSLVSFWAFQWEYAYQNALEDFEISQVASLGPCGKFLRRFPLACRRGIYSLFNATTYKWKYLKSIGPRKEMDRLLNAQLLPVVQSTTTKHYILRSNAIFLLRYDCYLSRNKFNSVFTPLKC